MVDQRLLHTQKQYVKTNKESNQAPDKEISFDRKTYNLLIEKLQQYQIM